MMQQVATVKNDSAASSLPLDIASNGESKQAFNDIMKNESQRSSAFEQARNRADNSAIKQHNRANEKQNSDTAEHSAGDNIDKGSQQSSDKSVDKSQDGNINKHSNVQKESLSSQQAREAQQKAQTAHVNESEEIRATKLSEKKQALEAKQAIAKQQDTNETLHASIEVDNPDFDYISYVTQLAEFGGDHADAYKEAMTSSDISFHAEISQDEANESAINLLIPTNGELSDNEFLTISLNKQDLQTILDAQNAQLDLNAGLNKEELVKLQDIIASMLGQLEQQQSKASASDAENVKEADQALLASLLLGKQNTDAADTTAAINEDAMVANTKALDAIKNASKEASVNALSEFDKTLQATNAAKLQSQNEQQAEFDAATQRLQNKDAWYTTPDLEAKLPAEKGIWSKTPDTHTKQNSDVLKTPINNLASLSDEQTTSALNNISERVQSIVSDLNTPAKGNEFLAALQVGVKEFKQQLANGREPGIDLKSLINDAIASTNTELDAGVQPKIDAAISQVNAVLNLANLVNHSATQQQSLVLSPSDAQFSKELNILQTEGTKLANSSTNQVNSPVNVDKAFNIMKAEGQNQLAEKVRWMVNARNPSAEIRLDPPDLGGMQIKVNLSGDTAQVNFNVQSLAAKEMLDQAAPRLRDMLAQQGIELGQSSVQQDSQQQGGQTGDGSSERSHASTGALGATEETLEDMGNHIVEQRISSGAIGGIDYYA